MIPNESLAKAAAHWCHKTLAQLRDEARAEKTGIAFDALRVAGGPRLMLVACITGDQAPRLLRHITLVEELPRADWATLSLFDFAVRARSTGKLAFEIERDDSSMVSALAISAADPCSVSTLVEMLGLKP